MNRLNHGLVVLLLMASAGGLLAWKSSRIAIVYADGLRYIRQARLIDQGSLAEGLLKAVDHPAYPVAIAAAHRVIGGDQPEDWQSAAQLVSVVCGILLVVPFYLLSAELFGGRVAWLSVALAFLSPVVVNVFSDALSEAMFLLFWTWALWSALRFLREGRFGWLPLMLAFAAGAFWTRPEGILLPAALAAAILFMPALRTANLNWPRWWAAVGVMIVGPLLVAGPLLYSKGGLGTKPAIARILGTAPKSGAEAVERNRPLEEAESPVKTYAAAAKAAFEATRDATTLPVLLLGLFGVWKSRVWRERPRQSLLVGIVMTASALALIRLHATGGYCSPRHTLIPAFLIVAGAGYGLNWLLNAVEFPVASSEKPVRLGPIFWLVGLAVVGFVNREGLAAPVNKPFAGYKTAADWLEKELRPGEKIVDLTGWTQFYGQAEGYTFADVIYAGADQNARWVVAREAHVHGPWVYCRMLRSLIGLHEPVAIFPKDAEEGEARVLVYDRREEGQPLLVGSPEGTTVLR